jgi:hypothetical protein
MNTKEISEQQTPAPIHSTVGLECADFQEHPGWRNNPDKKVGVTWDGEIIWTGGRADDCEGRLLANCYGQVWHNGTKWDAELATVADYKPTHWMRLPILPNENH